MRGSVQGGRATGVSTANLPLIDEDKEHSVALAVNEMNDFSEHYQQCWLDGMHSKIGLTTNEESDLQLATELYHIMESENVDFTQLFRGLAETLQGDARTVRILFDNPEKFDPWHARWLKRLSHEPIDQQARYAAMNAVNPIYIPRNHKAEEALYAAEK